MIQPPFSATLLSGVTHLADIKPAEDSRFTAVVKFACAPPLKIMVAALAILEIAVRIMALPTCLFREKNFSVMKEEIESTAKTMIDALVAIATVRAAEKKDHPLTAPQSISDLLKSAVDYAQNTGKALYTKAKENPKVSVPIIVGAITITAIALSYYFQAPGGTSPDQNIPGDFNVDSPTGQEVVDIVNEIPTSNPNEVPPLSSENWVFEGIKLLMRVQGNSLIHSAEYLTGTEVLSQNLSPYIPGGIVTIAELTALKYRTAISNAAQSVLRSCLRKKTERPIQQLKYRNLDYKKDKPQLPTITPEQIKNYRWDTCGLHLPPVPPDEFETAKQYFKEQLDFSDNQWNEIEKSTGWKQDDILFTLYKNPTGYKYPVRPWVIWDANGRPSLRKSTSIEYVKDGTEGKKASTQTKKPPKINSVEEAKVTNTEKISTKVNELDIKPVEKVNPGMDKEIHTTLSPPPTNKSIQKSNHRKGILLREFKSFNRYHNVPEKLPGKKGFLKKQLEQAVGFSDNEWKNLCDQIHPTKDTILRAAYFYPSAFPSLNIQYEEEEGISISIAPKAIYKEHVIEF